MRAFNYYHPKINKDNSFFMGCTRAEGISEEQEEDFLKNESNQTPTERMKTFKKIYDVDLEKVQHNENYQGSLLFQINKYYILDQDYLKRNSTRPKDFKKYQKELNLKTIHHHRNKGYQYIGREAENYEELIEMGYISIVTLEEHRKIHKIKDDIFDYEAQYKKVQEDQNTIPLYKLNNAKYYLNKQIDTFKKKAEGKGAAFVGATNGGMYYRLGTQRINPNIKSLPDFLKKYSYYASKECGISNALTYEQKIEYICVLKYIEEYELEKMDSLSSKDVERMILNVGKNLFNSVRKEVMKKIEGEHKSNTDNSDIKIKKPSTDKEIEVKSINRFKPSKDKKVKVESVNSLKLTGWGFIRIDDKATKNGVKNRELRTDVFAIAFGEQNREGPLVLPIYVSEENQPIVYANKTILKQKLTNNLMKSGDQLIRIKSADNFLNTPEVFQEILKILHQSFVILSPNTKKLMNLHSSEKIETSLSKYESSKSGKSILQFDVKEAAKISTIKISPKIIEEIQKILQSTAKRKEKFASPNAIKNNKLNLSDVFSHKSRKRIRNRNWFPENIPDFIRSELEKIKSIENNDCVVEVFEAEDREIHSNQAEVAVEPQNNTTIEKEKPVKAAKTKKVISEQIKNLIDNSNQKPMMKSSISLSLFELKLLKKKISLDEELLKKKISLDEELLKKVRNNEITIEEAESFINT